MIQAASSTRFPYLRVRVHLGGHQAPAFRFEIEALVDTGFDGGLAIPPGIIPSSVLPLGRSAWTLADGARINATAYFCDVSIAHLPSVPTVVIELTGVALLGRNVTDHFRLTFDHGQRVMVAP